MHTRLFRDAAAHPFPADAPSPAALGATAGGQGLWGMRLMLRVWQLLGRKAFTLLLWPVTAIYWLTARSARQASRQWLRRVKEVMAQRQILPPPAEQLFTSCVLVMPC